MGEEEWERRDEKERTKRCTHGGRRMEGKKEEMRSWGKKNRRKEQRDALMGEEEWKKRDEKERMKRYTHGGRRMEDKR